MTTRHQVVAKTLATAALALGLCVGQAAPAGADDPDPLGADSDPYRTFSCHCHETAPAGSRALTDEIHRGLQEGHTAWLAELPAPTGR